MIVLLKFLLLLKAACVQSLITDCIWTHRLRSTFRRHRNSVQLSVAYSNCTREVKDPISLSRRSWAFQFLSVYGSSWIVNSLPASAGLVFFPCTDRLLNTYHIMRAGESLLETQDILSTNPLFLYVCIILYTK